jgi:hypothetical protein
VFLEGLKDKGGGNMAINGFDKVLRNQGKRVGNKNEPVSESGPAEAAVEATVQGVNGDTDAGAAKEEDATPRNGNNNGNKKGEEGKKSGKGSKNGVEKGEETKGNARKLLRKAVKDAIRSQGKEVATALLQKVVDGDKRSTEMMFSLIEKKKKGGALSSRHGGLTAADLLGSEEEWESETDEAMEGQSELGMGGREPEGQ